MTAIVAMETRALGLKLIEFAKRGRANIVEALLYLMEFDNRRGWVDFNCRSLFDFCTKELGLLPCASSFRVRSVRVLRQYPQAEAYLRDGRLYMKTLAPLLDVLTPENASDVFDRCSRKSRKEVDKIVAELDPKIGPKTVIRAKPVKEAPLALVDVSATLSAPSDATREPVALVDATGSTPSGEVRAPAAEPFMLVTEIARKLGLKVKPVNARDYSISGTVDQDWIDRLEQLTNLLSHTIPNGDPIEVLRRAMQIAVEKKLKQRAGKTSSPRKSSSKSAEYITAETKRIVWERDNGCCAWPHDDGKVCASRWMVEFDHVIPPSLGGDSSPGNVRLLCEEHNEQHARNTYGNALIEKMKRRPKRTKD